MFAHSRWDQASQLESYFREVFFESPWTDPELPSFVLEAAGEVAGFAGVIPRPFVFGGRRVRGAVMTQLMVDPEARGGAGTRLVDRAFQGQQEFLFTDVPNEAARAVWTKLGARVAPTYAFQWTLPVRPARHAAARLGTAPLARAARLLARPGLDAFDVAMNLAPRSRLRSAPTGRAVALDVGRVAAAMAEIHGGRTLRPDYSPETLQWVLDHLDRHEPGRLDQAGIIGPDGRLCGWYVARRNPGGTAQLVHLVARSGAHDTVLRHAWHRAHRDGAVALAGRHDTRSAPALDSLGARFHPSGPPVLVHTRQEVLATAVLEGSAVLTGLEGEWWLGF